MIKITAIVFIVCGFVFSGQCITSYYRRRAEILGDIVMMLSVMQTRLRYECLPLAALLRVLEENGKMKNLGFITVCREKSESGDSFPHAWRESIEKERELCRLIRDVLPYLIQLGDDLGSTDLEGQLACCEYYERIFRAELDNREEQNKKYIKLFPTLGAVLGIWAAILII